VIAAAFALALASFVPQEAPSVHGVVLSAEGDRPIAYAQVRVVGDSVAGWTNQQGRYRLDGLEPGTWRLRVAHPGHDSLDLAVTVPGNRALEVDVILRALPGPPVDALSDFEPFRVAYTLPALLNGEEVTRLIRDAYPEDLAIRGVGGESVLWLWLDELGTVVRSSLSESSGQPALDSIALGVSERMRFRPAKNRDQAVRVIVRIPVIFNVLESGEPTGSG